MKVELTHKSITKSDVGQIRRMLEDVIEAATLETANFDAPQNGIQQSVTLDLHGDVTPFVRNMVKSHHSAWIISPLKVLLHELERFES
jgi:hypothetical protein